MGRGRQGLLVGLCGVLAGCAIPRQMLAPPDDFADYRAFRLASREGPRLALAQTYLRRHPDGRWAAEVTQAFDTEEDAWFDAAKGSRSRALDYLVQLPHGPHASAARSLLALYDQHDTDLDTLELMASWRHTSAMLDLEAERRRRVGEVLLEELAAITDPATANADLNDLPPALASVMRGSVTRTWGTGPVGRREDDLFFVLPTPKEAEARVAEVRLQLTLDSGRVVGGQIEGEDLFVRWAEANETRVLDASDAADRAHAADSANEILSGALEARFPAARCDRTQRGDFMTRACDGWYVTVRMGQEAGDPDVITVFAKVGGPRGRAQARPRRVAAPSR